MSDKHHALRQDDRLSRGGRGASGQGAAVAEEQVGNDRLHRCSTQPKAVGGIEAGQSGRDDDAVGLFGQGSGGVAVHSRVGQCAMLKVDEALRI